MAFRVGLHNFSKGVLADELQGRQDVDAYNAGMKRCENAYILKYGGIAGRPGTRLVYETTSALVRLMPFEASKDQTYMLLLEQAVLKPMFRGGVVVEAELAITAITKAANALVSVAFHGFSVADEVFFDGQTGMTEINGRIGKVMTVPGTGSFTVNIDTTGFGTWTGNTGGVTNSGPPPAPPPPPPVPPPPPPPADPDLGVAAGGGSDSGTIFGGGRGLWFNIEDRR